MTSEYEPDLNVGGGDSAAARPAVRLLNLPTLTTLRRPR